MALFRRNAHEPTDVTAEVAVLAREIFAERGVETTLQQTDDPSEPMLVAIDGTRFPLFNLVALCRSAPVRERRAIVEAHADRLLRTLEESDDSQLTEPEVRSRIRSRLLNASALTALGGLSYARDFSPGLIQVLCLDSPDAVRILQTSTLEDLPLPVEELFRQGQRNTNDESIESRDNIGGNAWMLSGESLFIASKLADMQTLIESTIGPAPHGVVVGVPERSSLLYTVISGPESVEDITQLLRVVDNIAFGEPEPVGGVVSSGIYYCVDGIVELVGGRSNQTEALAIDGSSGRFGELLASF
ncbi:MAG: hypothetical protein JWN80_2035 [Microbacteriaceae bacterium]|nr:hypothetical protein [Microbacteriaceae bacterium]